MKITEEKGMDEHQIEAIHARLKDKTIELKGTPMLFQIIELAKDLMVCDFLIIKCEPFIL